MAITYKEYEARAMASSRGLNMKDTMLMGLAGGMAEVVLVLMYCFFTNTSVSYVGYEITHSIFTGPAPSVGLAWLGLFIHFALSSLVAIGFVSVFRGILIKLSKRAMLMLSMSVLACIWAINFFMVLPMINPTFVTIMPLGFTLLSKLAFGFCMGLVVCRGSR